MGWQDQEGDAGGGLINIGPDPKKHKRRFTGLLLGFRRHPKHPDRERVWCMDREGNEVDVVGNVSIVSALGPDHIGKLIDLEYQGEDKVAGGNTKKLIRVRVWEGDWTTDMKKWSPKLYAKAMEVEGELLAKKEAKEAKAGSDEDGPPPGDEDNPFAEDEPDDLPF